MAKIIIELLSAVICLWAAVRLRREQAQDEQPTDAWFQAKRSMRYGTTAVTLLVLGYLGVVRYAHGAGIPSAFIIAVTIGLTAVVLFGFPVEITGNALIDSVLLSAGLVACCFAAVNGLPLAVFFLSLQNLYRWLLACIVASVLIRAALWAREGE